MDIMNRLPVKSLLQFRAVSKQWKFSIDSFDFIRFRNFDSNLNVFSLKPVASSERFHVQDMPEEVGVEEFSPPYYISQLGGSLIIFGSFGFGAFRIINAWALDFEDGIISSCNLLFTIPHPAGHFLKLLGFSNANEPIVEAEIVQQWYRSLQVFHPIIEGFVNVHVEANHYIAIMKMAPYEAFACRCGKGDVVLRESYQPNTRGKLYYACPAELR
ncbi:transposase, MuDR, MULE transposase domain protein [Tanacetum coccineum]